MRIKRLFNDHWLYAPEEIDPSADEKHFQHVALPHTNILLPLNHIDDRDYQFISTYRKHFKLPQRKNEQRVFIDFDGVMLACQMYLTGKLVGEHRAGFTPFSIEITDEVGEDENTFDVYVDSHESKDVPPYGHLVDYLTYGGIYRDVFLRLVDPCHIENVFVQTQNILQKPSLECDLRLSHSDSEIEIMATLIDRQGKEIARQKAPASEADINLVFPRPPAVELWSLEEPTLYILETTLRKDGEILDGLKTRFGFRDVEFRSDEGFFLNGERVKLFGLNRHQSYPYIGAAAPARLQRRDADILKTDLACNVVRTSHYPQSPHFLNRCDEIGLLVFEEIPGWQHIGNKEWQAKSLGELKAMIERDRNHPSIIMWGVRINESRDLDPFYTRTNEQARELDPTRPTGGVRCFQGSSFLEDVYTYNDFSNTVLEPSELPYLITEFAGHKFPTKIWDNEDRLIEYALLHAKIQNQQMCDDRIAGAIGWCAFDYATHLEFGSGDRICYHGVMDVFRLPKWAANFYESQQTPRKRIVLKPATHWTLGDRSGGGINPLVIFSNCDEIEVYFGDRSMGLLKPDRATYPNLPHPPFVIDCFGMYSTWGKREFHDLRVLGYINGEVVRECYMAGNKVNMQLELFAEDDWLYANGNDMTRIVLRITDIYGNPLPYASKVVSFEIDGDAELIGENPFPLIGGQTALFIRSGFQPSKVNVTASAPGLPKVHTEIEIVPVDEDSVLINTWQ